MEIDYTYEQAFKIPWQAWMACNTADPIFYDPSKPNNGLNLKSSNYSGKQDYEIYVQHEVDMIAADGETIVTIVAKRSAACPVVDYAESPVDPAVWSQVITLLDEDDNVLPSNVTLYNRTFKIKSVWTLLSGVMGDYPEPWAIHRTQKNNGGFDIYEFKSFGTNLTQAEGNPMGPVTGSTHLKLEVGLTTVTTTCEVDGAMLVENQAYLFTAFLDFTRP